MFNSLIYFISGVIYFALCFVCLSTISAFSQVLPNPSTVYQPKKESYIKYQTSIYTIVYDTVMKAPLCATYKLYMGGGDCSRKLLHFKRAPGSATAADYAASGYDEGHMVNAEDFANNCENEAKTFSFYNCAPQTPQLNRGIWKVKESSTRELSQTDSLNVIVGCLILKKHRVIGNSVTIPYYYYRIVQSMTTKKILSCALFTNTTQPTLQNVSINQLNALIPFKLPIIH